MQKNIDLNCLDVHVNEIDWFRPDHALLEPQSFDIIIGSEVIYREPILQPLINTIDYFLKSGGSLYLVSAGDRACYLHFFHKMTEMGYKITTKALNLKPLNETEIGWESEELSFNRSEELTVGWFTIL